MSALRFAPLRCGVPHVRLAQRASRALTLGLLRGHSDLEGLPGRLIHFFVGVRRLDRDHRGWKPLPRESGKGTCGWRKEPFKGPDHAQGQGVPRIEIGVLQV